MLWIKAFHIIFVVTWFAGLFYLPRLFIYHHAATDSVSQERFCMMERKLIRVIMNPSAVLAMLFGAVLLWDAWAAFGSTAWMWIKLGLVVTLVAFHAACLRIAQQLQRGSKPHSDRFLRVFNELPALVLISVVILVVVKPSF